MSTDASGGWDALHEQHRYRPAYPSEPVVRFVSRHLGGVTDDPGHRASVLDLGAGAGRHSVLVARAGHTAVSTDRSIEGLRHAREVLAPEGSPLRGCTSDMGSLPFASASFDAVIAYGVVNYATRSGLEQTIREVHRVLRPGGWVQVVTRTTDDHRAGGGREVEPGTYRLDIEETNEGGMLMRFIDRGEVDDLFGAFQGLVVDRIDHTSGGGTIANSDWVIEAQR